MDIAKIAGGYVSAIGKVDKIARAAHGLVCLATTLGAFTNPAALLLALTSIAANAANMILGAVGGMIQARINGLLGMVLAPLMMLQNYINRIAALTNTFSSLYIGIEVRASSLLNYIFDTQDCANQAAQMMNCISKVIANKVTQKVLPKINSVFGKLEAEVAEQVFKTGGILEQQVGRRVRTAERLTAQLSILR